MLPALHNGAKFLVRKKIIHDKIQIGWLPSPTLPSGARRARLVVKAVRKEVAASLPCRKVDHHVVDQSLLVDCCHKIIRDVKPAETACLPQGIS